MNKIIKNKELLEQMGKESRKIALLEYSLDDVINKHFSFYESK